MKTNSWKLFKLICLTSAIFILLRIIGLVNWSILWLLSPIWIWFLFCLICAIVIGARDLKRYYFNNNNHTNSRF